MKPALTEIQLKVAYALAHQKGHAWSGIPMEEFLSLPELTSDRIREYAIDKLTLGFFWGLADQGPQISTDGIVYHVFPDGLRWQIQTDGETKIEAFALDQGSKHADMIATLEALESSEWLNHCTLVFSAVVRPDATLRLIPAQLAHHNDVCNVSLVVIELFLKLNNKNNNNKTLKLLKLLD